MGVTASKTPVLSIAVPSYNVEAYLERGLATYDDPRMEGRLQVIVVNDGSTDATECIARRFCEKSPHMFTLVNKENGGHGSAVNAGIAAARGTYFRVIDGDDWADTENLVRLLDVLEASSADLVVDVKQEVDMLTHATQLFSLPVDVPLEQSLPFEQMCTNEHIIPFIMIHTLTVRTDYLRRVGLHLLEKTFYVDFEYVVKATLDAQTVQFADVNVYQYLVGNANQSVADANYVKRWSDHTRVTKEILRLYGTRKGELSSACAAYLRRRCVLLCNTHYKIALIFDVDRRRGIQRAKEFRAFLRAHYPDIAAATDKRYRTAYLLHYLGVNSQEKLNKFAQA